MKILLKVLFFSIIFTVLGFVYAPMQDSSSDAQKDEQAINAFKPTVHHKDWTSIVKSSKGKITSPILVKSKANAEALSKVNKIAIIAFNVSDWRGSDDMLNEFYDVLKQSFEKNGFSVLSANEIVNN